MTQDPKNLDTELETMRRRMDQLERENQRLQEKLEPMFGPDNPCFDARRFMRVMQRTMLILMLPMVVPAALLPAMVSLRAYLPHWYLGPVPVIDVAGSGSGIPGVGLGIIAVGGASAGVIACGGMAIGIVAIGGGACGIIAMGGGAFGFIALGGGACGYIAIGGVAIGRYALGQRAYGKSCLGLNRQDPQAIEFFVPLVPGLRAAVTTAMPVLPISRQT